ncbi:MAG: YitT family protein, partial [Firmicutes bacterium]|nr:YitT family protein [Bacillota bacterium]
MRNLPGRSSSAALRQRRMVVAAVNTLYLLLGSFVLAFGLNAFVVANGLAEGGLTGVSILLHYLTGFPVGVLYPLVNIPLWLAGIHLFGRGFAAKTLVGVALLSLALTATRSLTFPMPDKLLASIYGGSFIGLGLGLIFRSGGSSGGVDIIAKYLKDRRGVPMGDTYLATDVLVLGVAALLLGANTALYSLIITFITGRVVDYVQEGPRRAKAAIIISDYPEMVARLITEEFDRGATFLDEQAAKRGAKREWPEPQPFPDNLAPVPRFEAALLPESVHPWIADIAERVSCPPDFVAI